MSIEKIKNVINNLNSGENWTVQVFKINTCKHNGESRVNYCCRKIKLRPEVELEGYFKEIMNLYLGDGKKSIDSYKDLRVYDGSTDGLTIYKLCTDDKLISDEYICFNNAIANASKESNPLDYNSAFLVKGTLNLNGSEVVVKIVSMMKPITQLRRKFILFGDEFVKCKQPVLNLRPIIDVIIVDNVVYFMNLSGEKLFNMERSYKIICNEKIKDIEQAGIVSNMETFKEVASTGHNPRKFVAFNDNCLKAMKNPAVLKTIAEQFKIPINDSGTQFNTAVKGASEDIIKVLCNRAMLHPINLEAFEVDGAQRWK